MTDVRKNLKYLLYAWTIKGEHTRLKKKTTSLKKWQGTLEPGILCFQTCLSEQAEQQTHGLY